MRRLLIIITLSIITPAFIYAGVIMKKTGETIEDVTIQSVSSNDIVYIQNGSEYTISKSDISAILHDDGRFEEIIQRNKSLDSNGTMDYSSENDDDYEEKEYNVLAYEKSGYDGIIVEYRVIKKNQKQNEAFEYLGTTPFAYVTDNEAKLISSMPKLYQRGIENIMEIRPLVVGKNTSKIEFRLSKSGYSSIIVSPIVKIDFGGKVIILPLKKLKPLNGYELPEYEETYNEVQNNINNYSDNYLSDNQTESNYNLAANNSSVYNSSEEEFYIDDTNYENSSESSFSETSLPAYKTQDNESKEQELTTRQSNQQIVSEHTKKSSRQSQRSNVEVLYGYLKIFPNELGEFYSEPKTIIAQINKQALHDYNTWRIPTNEELSLLRANGYIGDGQYMSSENKHGMVLLVTDSEEYKSQQTTDEYQPKSEDVKSSSQSNSHYVDLGLPSGIQWKDGNEDADLYNYDQAMTNYGNRLPTIDEYVELREYCQWLWNGKGYIVRGKNGNSIFLPAEGWKSCNGIVENVGVYGYYISQTLDKEKFNCYLYFNANENNLYCGNSCVGRSVRLVKR